MMYTCRLPLAHHTSLITTKTYLAFDLARTQPAARTTPESHMFLRSLCHHTTHTFFLALLSCGGLHHGRSGRAVGRRRGRVLLHWRRAA
jgi:hypothetical protein